MKSEFYREVSNEHKTRKSTTKQKPRKDVIHSTHINPIRMSKGLKSQTRSLIKSIDLNYQAKHTATDRMLKMSFSRPFVQLEDDVQPLQINEKSIMSVCCECQGLREKHQRELKSLRMHYEEERTAHSEKFIQMQKKFLTKESEYINIANDYRSLMHENEDLKDTITEVMQQMNDLRHKLEHSEEQISRLGEQLKKYQDQNKFFNHFLTAFVEQTRNMLYWCQLFENNYEDLPKNIDSVRQDLTNRKIDLDVILKESVSYQHNNFGVSTIKDSNNSSFFGSEEDGTQSFMKYFKQNTIATKVKNSRMTPLTEQKLKSPFSEALTVNKENVNTMNKLSFEDLIHSRIQNRVDKTKSHHMKDDLLRMMLIQAQTIQHNTQSRTSRNSKSHFEVDGSILSSIRKRADHYVQ